LTTKIGRHTRNNSISWNGGQSAARAKFAWNTSRHAALPTSPSFYERARGSYLAAEQKAAYRKSDPQTYRAQTPKQRRISKLDVAQKRS
jgi:hypothetical protein